MSNRVRRREGCCLNIRETGKFTDFVSELKEQLSDNDSGWILSDNGEILPFSKN